MCIVPSSFHRREEFRTLARRHLHRRHRRLTSRPTPCARSCCLRTRRGLSEFFCHICVCLNPALDSRGPDSIFFAGQVDFAHSSEAAVSPAIVFVRCFVGRHPGTLVGAAAVATSLSSCVYFTSRSLRAYQLEAGLYVFIEGHERAIARPRNHLMCFLVDKSETLTITWGGYGMPDTGL